LSRYVIISIAVLGFVYSSVMIGLSCAHLWRSGDRLAAAALMFLTAMMTLAVIVWGRRRRRRMDDY
jgi:hypothetical protein